MNRVLDALAGLVMWPLLCLWQLFDRIMVNVIATAVACAAAILLLAVWIHFSPKPEAPLIQAAPAVIVAPSPAVTTGPYWQHDH